MMNLFNQNLKFKAPLADRMRPTDLDEFIGQEHILGKGKPLRRAIEKGEIFSLIFWGPPGSGKTTLAKIIAKKAKTNFVSFSAVAAGVKQLREIIKQAELQKRAYKKPTILFVDELHHFNKSQQATFLPYVENGTIVLLGVTTENPSFEIIAPLLSRSQVYTLNPLSKKELEEILERALKDKEKGLGKENVILEDQAKDFLIDSCAGDARRMLNSLEIAVLSTQSEKGKKFITLQTLEDALQTKALKYDKKAEEHYNVISAFIKSMRNSDPDAALYWLARMVEAGEDPRFIARRMVIFASEDIGNADPQALAVATAVAQAVEFVGMPEAQINLAQAVTYLASAPKSNASYKALLSAKEDVKKYGVLPVPLHLRNPVTPLMKKIGYGKGYQYAHDFDEGKTDMECLPEKLKGKKYYNISKDQK